MVENMPFEGKVPWSYKAITALWRRDTAPNLPSDAAPVVGGSYKINVKNIVLKKNDFIFVEYLPALAYFNGFEEDLKGLRICEATLSNVHSCEDVDSPSQDAIITINSIYSFNDFKRLSLSESSDNDWGDEFFCGEFHVQTYWMEEYINLIWDSEGYSGEHYLLLPNTNGFEALYYHGWFPGMTDGVCAGRMKLSDKISKRLRRRIWKSDGTKCNWSGRIL